MAVSTGRGVGYVLSHEQFPPGELIEYAVAAEAAGFDAVWASDHFHPWQDNQGHAGPAWIPVAASGRGTGGRGWGPLAGAARAPARGDYADPAAVDRRVGDVRGACLPPAQRPHLRRATRARPDLRRGGRPEGRRA